MDKKILITSGIILGILAVLLLSGCVGETEKPEQTVQEVTFAMLPQMSNAQVAESWAPLIKKLESETGLKIVQVFPADFNEHAKWGREGKIDFAYSNPFVYAQMSPKPGEREHGHKALALAVGSEGATFYGEFLVRADNEEIKEFKDIKGKNGWIVGYTSAGGYLYPLGYALDHGIDLRKDCNLTASPGDKQEKVIMAVYNRETDFGTVRNGMREKLTGRIDLSQIRVLAETDRYPAWVFSAYDGVDPKIAEKMKKAMLTIPPEMLKTAALPGDIIGFRETTDKDLDPVRELAKKVGMEY